MTTFARLCAGLAVIMLAGLAYAQEGHQAPKGDRVRGEVVKIDGAKLVIKNQEGKEITLTTDDKTKVNIAGKEAKVSDLKVGQKIVAAVADGKVTRIEVPKPRQGGEGHEGH